MNNYEKQGYLDTNYKIFHLLDYDLADVTFHYHDFNKVILFINGNVSYSIEGKVYDLTPYDILLVNAGDIHKPIIHDDTPYERIVIYISRDFIANYMHERYDLNHCFLKSKEEHSNLLRLDPIKRDRLYELCSELIQTFHCHEFANELYQDLLILQFMIFLNRAILTNQANYIETSISNKKVLAIIDYINNNLTESISIDSIAETFYLSRSYLMHFFKAETGCTIGNYITEKRLFHAKDLIKHGSSVTEACFQSGFKDYSTFSRAFKQKFKTTPKNAGKL